MSILWRFSSTHKLQRRPGGTLLTRPLIVSVDEVNQTKQICNKIFGSLNNDECVHTFGHRIDSSRVSVGEYHATGRFSVPGITCLIRQMSPFSGCDLLVRGDEAADVTVRTSSRRGCLRTRGKGSHWTRNFARHLVENRGV